MLWGRKRRKSGGEAFASAVAVVWPGMDSAFYEIERRLEAAGLTRYAGETFGTWLLRLQGVESGFNVIGLRSILELHYRYRFDPAGVDVEEIRTLREKTEAWLAESDRGSGSRE